ncbi:RDD family protein [Georgenia sp. Z1344]|uniref:RDD family protein n=1 Tax=Georgenia sp. Z1344 TaxID=3416706 RepID=UPI003CF22A06
MPDADPSSANASPARGVTARGGAAREGAAAAAPAGSGPVRPEELAPFGRRVAALVIDWAIAMAIAYGFAGGDAMAILGIFAAQRVLVGGLTGSSIGHRLLGLRIVHATRGRVPFLSVLVRTVLLCLVLPPLWRTVEGVPLHDDLARSRLVRG